MKRRGRKIMGWIVTILILLIGLIIIYFMIPYSRTRKEFDTITKEVFNKKENKEGYVEYFTEQDIADLPAPVQRYFRYCGYIGTPKMSYMKATFRDVDFSLCKDKPMIKIDYTQYNLVKEPIRIAYIDSSMYGIPFEGIDIYQNGQGSMKGVLGKSVTIFNERGKDMDQACLATFLSECLFVPNVALQNYITWEAMDDFNAKATISDNGITASGIFTFNEAGEMLSFTTNDRKAIAMDGTIEQVRWTAVCSEYREQNEIKKPTKLQAIWNYEDGDLIYFDSKDAVIEFNDMD